MQIMKVWPLAALLAVCKASPTPATELEARADSVTLCHGINYGEGCVTAPNSNGQCHNVSGNDNDQFSSIKLGPKTICIFFADFDCRGLSLIVREDQPDLRNQNFNDVISSFTCRGV